MPRHEDWQRLEALAPIIAAAAGDPAHPALVAWQEARRAEFEAVDGYATLERQHGPGAAEAGAYMSEHVEPAHDRVTAAYRQIARTTPTTLPGLAAQLAMHANMEDAESGMRHGWPEETILVSMRNAAMRLAQSA